jgi:carbamoyl-phosphate synthase large subunit
MGGQTGLNTAKGLEEAGILAKYGVELLGAKLESIDLAEDRALFKNAMEEIGIFQAQSGTATTMEQAFEIALTIGEFPIIIRPAFTLGGTGGGVAYNVDEFKQIVNAGIDASMTNQVLVEKSLLGWKEYELEVMRDQGDNVVIICSIENLDPMGVHTVRAHPPEMIGAFIVHERARVLLCACDSVLCVEVASLWWWFVCRATPSPSRRHRL